MSDLAPGGLFLEPTGSNPAATALPLVHHPQPEPSDYLCTCGKIREACVHESIRAFWSAVSESPASVDFSDAVSDDVSDKKLPR